MIKGTFNIWEFVVLVAASVILFGGFALNNTGIVPPEIAVFAGFLTMAAVLLVRPVWLLVNSRRIRNWEHVSAKVANKQFSEVKYHHTTKYRVTLTLCFKDEMGKEYNESFTAPAFMRQAAEGDEYEIAFDPKHPDRLIALDPARKQAVLMTIFGIILEMAIIALWIMEVHYE
ncbi:MAG: DUF3592 domain-containing protein [Oscillospiraceae bacterium]|nr:DUF3592 domain-containing protein [Oscillospiraceae bacterium]